MGINVKPSGCDRFLRRLLALCTDQKHLFGKEIKPEVSVDIGKERFSGDTDETARIQELFNGVNFEELAPAKEKGQGIQGDNPETRVVENLFENLLELCNLYSLRDFINQVASKATTKLKPILEEFNKKAKAAGKEGFAQFRL